MEDTENRSVAVVSPAIEADKKVNVMISNSNSGFTISHRAPSSEVRIDPDKRPNFSNITDDYNLLEHMVRYSRFCEHYNMIVPQMAQSLARAIGIQNGGRVNVIIYDYLLAIPEYPATVNGVKQALHGEGRWCNVVCYKNQLFGVCVFPITDNVTFFFPEFSSYTQYVQQLIFTFGNKSLGFCPERQALAFEFKSVNGEQQPSEPPQPILLTATLKRKISPIPIPNMVSPGEANGQREFIQLE